MRSVGYCITTFHLLTSFFFLLQSSAGWLGAVAARGVEGGRVHHPHRSDWAQNRAVPPLAQERQEDHDDHGAHRGQPRHPLRSSGEGGRRVHGHGQEGRPYRLWQVIASLEIINERNICLANELRLSSHPQSWDLSFILISFMFLAHPRATCPLLLSLRNHGNPYSSTNPGKFQ